ncbi:MAG: energy-coupling factor ABC transporter permease [Thermoplasmata archaeon]|jgi:cobalt/nickel transport system permease protein|nr:energy-coupling factor ABC transporter permease [Thermoplasmata archaeon]
MDPAVAAMGIAEFVIVLGAVLLLTRKSLNEKDLPRVAILSAGIFVAQMVNFPIGGGTTGHLIGAALFAILVGPMLAMIGMTVVLIIQALMFGDGGITAFGLNALNMAIIAPLAGWGVYSLMDEILGKGLKSARIISVGIAAWASVFLAACAAAAELAVSYAISGGDFGIAATVSIPAMLGYHAVIGVGEAIITCGVVAYVWHVSPEFFIRAMRSSEPAPGWMHVARSIPVKAAFAILFVFALLVPLYFLYSSEGADGLERTISEAGVEEGEQVLAAPFSYGETYFGMFFAGLLGFVAVAMLALSVLRIFRREQTKSRGR